MKEYPEWIYLKKKAYYLNLYPYLTWEEICKECERFYECFVVTQVIESTSSRYNQYLRSWMARAQYGKMLLNAPIFTR